MRRFRVSRYEAAEFLRTFTYIASAGQSASWNSAKSNQSLWILVTNAVAGMAVNFCLRPRDVNRGSRCRAEH
ncbi:hypothetical protein SBA5_30060 [Candidatus Sulfotelmatomonas gaucii]|uniref:Uncharacterized protein n=1 Tax=Candidatus Sulfuritelmatomonas gaucii TaxID=2043161 RepID=A0A2N9LCY6_9BACT|nr:hypothetical protein SBA5_30060 [Candidatus Sulfotelmatomonas gaucii]